MDWLEELWERSHIEQIRLRPICEAEELSRQGLPEIGWTTDFLTTPK